MVNVPIQETTQDPLSTIRPSASVGNFVEKTKLSLLSRTLFKDEAEKNSQNLPEIYVPTPRTSKVNAVQSTTPKPRPKPPTFLAKAPRPRLAGLPFGFKPANVKKEKKQGFDLSRFSRKQNSKIRLPSLRLTTPSAITQEASTELEMTEQTTNTVNEVTIVTSTSTTTTSTTTSITSTTTTTTTTTTSSPAYAASVYSTQYSDEPIAIRKRKPSHKSTTLIPSTTFGANTVEETTLIENLIEQTNQVNEIDDNVKTEIITVPTSTSTSTISTTTTTVTFTTTTSAGRSNGRRRLRGRARASIRERSYQKGRPRPMPTPASQETSSPETVQQVTENNEGDKKRPDRRLRIRGRVSSQESDKTDDVESKGARIISNQKKTSRRLNVRGRLRARPRSDDKTESAPVQAEVSNESNETKDLRGRPHRFGGRRHHSTQKEVIEQQRTARGRGSRRKIAVSDFENEVDTEGIKSKEESKSKKLRFLSAIRSRTEQPKEEMTTSVPAEADNNADKETITETTTTRERNYLYGRKAHAEGQKIVNEERTEVPQRGRRISHRRFGGRRRQNNDIQEIKDQQKLSTFKSRNHKNYH